MRPAQSTACPRAWKRHGVINRRIEGSLSAIESSDISNMGVRRELVYVLSEFPSLRFAIGLAADCRAVKGRSSRSTLTSLTMDLSAVLVLEERLGLRFDRPLA